MEHRILRCKIDGENLVLDLDNISKIDELYKESANSLTDVVFHDDTFGKTTMRIGSQETSNELGPFIADIRNYMKEGIVGKYIEDFSSFEDTKHLKEDDTQQQDGDQQPQDDDDQRPEDNDNGVEVDPDVDSGDQVAGATQTQQETGNAPLQMPAAAPIPVGAAAPNGESLELADGANRQVAQDSSLQHDAINPEGEASISFKSGNYNHINELPQSINQKIETLTKTIMPLAEAALIELLGNNKAYKGDDFQATFAMGPDGDPKFDVHATYSVENWIGTDIAQEDIAQDAKYLLDRMKVVPGVNWRTCKIDVTDGSLTLDFTI